MSEKFRQAWAAWLENYGRPWWKQAIVWPFGVDVFALPPGARTLRWYAVAAFESLVVKPAQLFALCLFWWCWVPQFPLAQWFWNKRWPSHIQNGTDEYWRAVPTASSSLLHYGVINHICWLSVVATVFVAGTVMFSSDASNLGLAALINYFLASIGLVVAGQMFFLNSAPEASDYRVLAVFGNLLVAIAFVLEMIFVGDSRRLLPFSVAAISALGLPSFGIAVLSFGLLDQKWAFVSASTGAMSVASR